MPIPLAIAGGIGLARSIFGRKNRFKMPTMGPFSYNPDENDQELLLLRRRAQEENQRSRGNTVNEIGRAGLLGSSAAFDLLGEGERRGARALEDIDAGVFARRRGEALDQYNKELDFRRQVALQDNGADIDYSSRSGLLGLSGLGDIGEYLGDSYGMGEDDEDLDYFEYLKKKKGLPSRALLESSNYNYQPQRR